MGYKVAVCSENNIKTVSHTHRTNSGLWIPEDNLNRKQERNYKERRRKFAINRFNNSSTRTERFFFFNRQKTDKNVVWLSFKAKMIQLTLKVNAN